MIRYRVKKYTQGPASWYQPQRKNLLGLWVSLNYISYWGEALPIRRETEKEAIEDIDEYRSREEVKGISVKEEIVYEE